MFSRVYSDFDKYKTHEKIKAHICAIYKPMNGSLKEFMVDEYDCSYESRSFGGGTSVFYTCYDEDYEKLQGLFHIHKKTGFKYHIVD